MMRPRRPLLLAASLLGGCIGSTAGDTNVPCRPLSGTVRPPLFPGSVFTIVMENKHVSEIIRPGGPAYTNQLAERYAFAANYSDPLIHPSLPNYLWMTAGQNFGVLSDADPAVNHIASTSHLVDQIEAAGLTWKTYQESMGSPCQLTAVGGLYVPKHNPFIYFDDVNGWDGASFTRPQRCIENVVDYSRFDADLQAGNTPRYVFITPNEEHDTHDGTVQGGDEWLAREIPKILASPAYTRGGVLFLTYDEGSLQTDHVPMIVISPYAKAGHRSQVAYTHSSFLKTVQRILGLDELLCGATPEQEVTMDDLFTVPLDRPAPSP